MLDKELKEEIITKIHIEHLPEQQQDEVIVRIGELIMKRLLLDVADALSMEDLEELKSLAGDKKTEELFTFLNKHVPNLDELTASASKNIIDQFNEK